jgi:hypothetical protein
MLTDNMRRGGDERDAKRSRVLDIEEKRQAGTREGWAVGFCLPRNSRGLVSHTTKVSDHTLNSLLNLFFPEKSIWIVGVVLY